MTPILALGAAVRPGLRLKPATALDRYVRGEYGDADSAWFVVQVRAANGSRPPRTFFNGDRFLIRTVRAIASFL